MVQLPEAYTMKNSLLWLIMGLYDQWFTNLTVNYVYSKWVPYDRGTTVFDVTKL